MIARPTYDTSRSDVPVCPQHPAQGLSWMQVLKYVQDTAARSDRIGTLIKHLLCTK